MTYALNLAVVILYGIILRVLFPEKWKPVFVFIATVHLCLFHALRNPFDYPDNVMYYDAYEEIARCNFRECFFELHSFTSWEPGYIFLNFALSRINPDPSLLFVVSSIFMVAGNMLVIKRMSYDPLLSVVIYMIYPLMFGQSMYVLRQHIAVVFVLLSMLNADKTAKCILYALSACIFHFSAICALPFVFFHKRIYSLSPSRLFSLVILFIAAAKIVIPLIVSIFPRYTTYSEDESNIVPFVLLASLFLMHLINGSLNKAETSGDKKILSFLFYGTIISVLMLGVPGGGRLTNYFIYVIPLAFPLLFKLKGLATNGIFKVLYSVAFMGLILYLSMNSRIFQYDYSFFWS